MSGITVSRKWWTDPRRSMLIQQIGDEERADGVILRVWSIALEYWGDQRSPIPIDVWKCLKYGDQIIAARLAEARPGGIYVKGAGEFLEWLPKNREAKSDAGKKGGRSRSGSAERDQGGRFKSNKSPDSVQTDGVWTPDNSRQTRPLLFSSSLSSLDSKESRERETLEAVDKSSQESGTKIKEGSLPERKTKIQSELKGAVNKAVNEWGITLGRWGFKRNPQTDEVEIARAIQRFGAQTVLDALIGKRFDRKTEKWNPADFCTAKHVLHADNIDRFATYASQHSERNERSLVDADQAMSEFLSGRSSG